MRSAERRKLNVLEMKCLKNFVISLLERGRIEEVHRGAGIGRELASTADQRVLRWFGHAKRMDESSMARRVLRQKLVQGRYEEDQG